MEKSIQGIGGRMKSFEDAFAELIQVEKGYWNDPVGGPTMYGVTEKVARDHGYLGDMRHLSLDMARTLAKNEYWDRYSCDQFAPTIGYLVFDAAYNGGHPAQWIQQAAGVTVDGSIGAKTIAAVRAIHPAIIALRFLSYRQTYMAGLKNWDSNSEGWARRIAKNMLIGAES